MATMAFSDLTNLLRENYGTYVADNVIRQGPGNWFMPEQSMLGLLRSRGKVYIGGADGNDRYVREWALKTAGKTAASFGASDAYPVAEQATYADASIGWKRVGEMISTDNLVRLATRRNAMRGNTNGLGQQFLDTMKAVIDAIEDQLFLDGTGNSSKNVDGVAAFLSTGNTYATINQSTQSLWQANITAAGSVALSNTLMRTMVRAAWNRGAIDESTIILMDLLQFQKFQTLFQDNVRYVPGQMTGVTIPHYADGSHLIPIKVVKGVPTSEVWMLSLNDLEVRFLDHTPDDELAEIRDDEIMYEGFPFGFEQVQTGKDSKDIMVKAYVNMCCVNPYRQSAITGLATTAP